MRICSALFLAAAIVAVGPAGRPAAGQPPKGGNPVDEILPILADPDAPPILSRADTVVEKWRHPVTYFKSALGLVLLREQILGPERFDPASTSAAGRSSTRRPPTSSVSWTAMPGRI